jgi:hypothetical protein
MEHKKEKSVIEGLEKLAIMLLDTGLFKGVPLLQISRAVQSSPEQSSPFYLIPLNFTTTQQ